VCFDEWGPLELKPIGGVAWARRNHPKRRRATYRRLQGTEQFLGFYDVHEDCLEGLLRKHKRVADILRSVPAAAQMLSEAAAVRVPIWDGGNPSPSGEV
jgi:hypothetical protein